MISPPRKRMTIAQLKRHMDRRFANTRKELRRSATKDDLRRFATKKDLERFATKEDLERYATKEDLAIGFGEVARRLDSLNAKMDSISKSLNQAIIDRDRIFDDHELRLRDIEARTAS
jgi:hypothetical protein